ncbi:MAG: hypothetical protein NTW21_14480 [Verrucomicrobia bacterium]|nr:hypothetical protein [Verrucomicrobiota bacterium]
MARIPQNSPEIERLIRLGEASRARLSDAAATIRQRLDVPARIGRSLGSHPAQWLGGTLAVGFAATLLFRRTFPTARKRRSLPALAWALAITTLRPVVKAWLTVQLKEFLVSQLRAKLMSRSCFTHAGCSKHP